MEGSIVATYVRKADVIENAKKVAGTYVTYTCMHTKCDFKLEAHTPREVKNARDLAEAHSWKGLNHVLVKTYTKISIEFNGE
jgi:hypothetical protein